ncbi:MAG: efflux RND transporter periplasmic adaptor subunit [Serratia inhibens]|uniref:efflux RND transporter periplasmic adaptor subunit n=1 Tax=Serratia inhibens TaxID=2338073 RepID=UPI003C7A02A9
MNRHQWLLICPLAMAMALTAGCDDKSEVKTSPRYVLSATALTESAGDLGLAGTVQARVTSALSFQTPGRVVARHVEVGDEIKAGQVLAQLDPLALQFSAQSAQASLLDAQAKLKNAVLTERRQRNLAAAQATSAEDLEESEQSLVAAQAAVGEAQARLRKANEQLSYAQLKARFNGVITSMSVEAGQTVAAGQTVLQVANLDQRDAVVDMPEAQLTNVALGHRFEVALQSDPAVKWVGELREIAPAADTATRLRRVKIAIDNAPVQFRLGAVVTASSLDSDRKTGPLVVPATALLERQQQHFVWVIDPNHLTVSLRGVQVMPLPDAGTLRVLSGLQDGEQIVIAGVHSLQPGQKIRIERASTL